VPNITAILTDDKGRTAVSAVLLSRNVSGCRAHVGEGENEFRLGHCPHDGEALFAEAVGGQVILEELPEKITVWPSERPDRALNRALSGSIRVP
jgi:hypothetical protein